MLLPEDINPKYCIYYNAAFILQALQNKDNQDLISLFGEVKQKNDIGYPLFIFCLDWLFFIGLINNFNGIIKLCI